MLTEVLLGILILVLLYGYVNKKPKKLPPGVWGLPVIGKLPTKGVSLSDQVVDLAKEYGKISSWRIGSRIFIFLSDYTYIKNAFAKRELAERPDLNSFAIFSNYTGTGIAFSNGPVWQFNRRFTLRHLKDLGMGKTRLEDAIQFEASCLVKDFERYAGSSGSLPSSINLAVLNIIWQLVASRRYDVEDVKMQNFQHLIKEASEEVQKKVFFVDLMPWLIPLLPKQWVGIAQAKEKLQGIFNLIRDHVKEHQKTLDSENPRDYMDAYLIEMEAQKDDANSTMSEEDLVICSFDLFTAGSETTSNTLRWALHYLIKYPDIQKKVQEEIDSVVPREVLPSVLQRNRMPYFEAMMLELHRVISLLRLGLFHTCSEDTEFEGYTIPKGSLVAANCEGCHRDPLFWEKPNEFYPEHFLDADGKLSSKREGFLPFSLGRRQCLGESLANMEIFVFLSALLQNFTFSVPPGKEMDLEKDPSMNIMTFPKEMDVIITKRK